MLHVAGEGLCGRGHRAGGLDELAGGCPVVEGVDAVSGVGQRGREAAEVVHGVAEGAVDQDDGDRMSRAVAAGDVRSGRGRRRVGDRVSDASRQARGDRVGGPGVCRCRRQRGDQSDCQHATGYGEMTGLCHESNLLWL